MKAGAKEILTYAEGKIVLEQGLVARLDLDSLSAPASRSDSGFTESRSAPRAGAVSIVSIGTGKWLSDLDQAKAEAAKKGRPILVLFTANMGECPWGTMFNQTVEPNPAFLQAMGSQFILLRINLSELGQDREVYSREEADRLGKKMNDIIDLREHVIGNIQIPALAIVSADGRSSKKVNMEGALAARRDMLNFTIRAIADANTHAFTRSSGSNRSSHFRIIGMIAAGILAGVWLIRR